MNKIYLDNSATTKPFSEVIEYMSMVAYENFYNPSSAYVDGINSEKELSKARDIIAESINANTNEIIFTSGGSESNNQGIIGTAVANKNRGNQIISSSIEHSSVFNTVKSLAKDYNIEFVKQNEYGEIDIDHLKEMVSKDTILVSLMLVNNEIGTINSIEEISEIIKTLNPLCHIHVDCVQGYLKQKIDVRDNFRNVDMLSASAHKLKGPRGIGFLYIKEKSKVSPFIYGGGQENGFRSGTENLPAIAGFAKAVEMQNDYLEKYKDIGKKKQYLKDKIVENIKDIRINSPETSANHILNVSFFGVRGQILLHALEENGILVSTGSACSAKKPGSRILNELGLCEKISDSAIRFSLNNEITKEEIDYTVEKLIDNTNKIRKVSKYKIGER